MKKTIDIVA